LLASLKIQTTCDHTVTNNQLIHNARSAQIKTDDNNYILSIPRKEYWSNGTMQPSDDMLCFTNESGLQLLVIHAINCKRFQ